MNLLENLKNNLQHNIVNNAEILIPSAIGAVVLLFVLFFVYKVINRHFMGKALERKAVLKELAEAEVAKKEALDRARDAEIAGLSSGFKKEIKWLQKQVDQGRILLTERQEEFEARLKTRDRDIERLTREHRDEIEEKDQAIDLLKAEVKAAMLQGQAKIEAMKKAKAEAERRAKEAAERRAKEDAARKAREAKEAKIAAERKAKEAAEAKAKAEQKAKEAEKARIEAEARAEAEAKRRAAQEHAKAEAAAQAEVEAREKIEATAPKPKSFSEGLQKTKGGLFAKMKALFSSDATLDEDLMDQLEELLLTSDIGPKTADKLFEKIQDGLSKQELKDSEAVMNFLRDETHNFLDIPFEDKSAQNPYVVLFIGVNGAGKTTSIGKLASQYMSEGKKVLLAAGDTYRAAAVEQLEVWAERSGTLFHKGKDQQDPSSVIFDAIKKGKEEGADVIIADTSGRLHTDKKLMEELKKIKRVMNKAHGEAPHDIFLVLDATNGQNAIHQAKFFNEAMDVTGIVLTKMDGTAKGGVILGICDMYHVPVRYVGIGEGIEDLRKMDVPEFVDALYAGE